MSDRILTIAFSGRSPSRLACALLSCALAWAGAGTSWAAQPAPAEFSERHPPGSINSVESADRALAAAARERARLEAQFRREESECHGKFFVTACVDDAKERRRAELSRVRPIELEAKSFKRRARVAERDQSLLERNVKDEAEKPQRAAGQRERAAGRDDKAAGDAARSRGRAAEAERNARQKRQRIAEHAAKEKRIKAGQAAEAKQRAANVAAYERKVKEAQQHQREVAARKAEKEAAKKKAAASAAEKAAASATEKAAASATGAKP